MEHKQSITISLAAIVVSMIVGTPFHAFVLLKLWDWFLVAPLGAPQITFGEAVGVGLVLSYITSKARSIDNKTRTSTEILAIALSSAIVEPLAWLSLGYLYLWLGAGK